VRQGPGHLGYRPPPRLLPRPLCGFAPARSSSSSAGVSVISRDACKASAETPTGITRDAFVVLQPSQHNMMVLAQGVEP
jgi:hypothetical protein